MAQADSLSVLRQNLQVAKEQLKNVDSDIKRLTGRDPNDDRYLRRIADLKSKSFTGRLSMKSTFRRAIDTLDGDSTGRSHNLDRLSSPTGNSSNHQKTVDEDLQVSLASSVVRVTEARSRKDVSQGLKKSDKERGRRMLGILQGTLNQFKAESAAAKKRPQMERRRQVDAKVEAREKEEKESLRRERAELFRARREQFLEVTLLQQKMRLIKGFESWKAEMEKMKGFCRTMRSPYIFFRPKVQTEESEFRTEATARVIDNLIEQRREKLEAYFEETSKNRRLAMSLKKTPNKDLNNSREHGSDDDEFAIHWQPPNDISKDSLLNDSTGNNKATLNSSVTVPGGGGPNAGLKSNSKLPDDQDLDAGDLSDTSEVFGMDADEPQLVDEEQHSVDPLGVSHLGDYTSQSPTDAKNDPRNDNNVSEGSHPSTASQSASHPPMDFGT